MFFVCITMLAKNFPDYFMIPGITVTQNGCLY